MLSLRCYLQCTEMSSFSIESKLFKTNQMFAKPHILGHINVYVSHFCMSACIYSSGRRTVRPCARDEPYTTTPDFSLRIPNETASTASIAAFLLIFQSATVTNEQCIFCYTVATPRVCVRYPTRASSLVCQFRAQVHRLLTRMHESSIMKRYGIALCSDRTVAALF